MSKKKDLAEMTVAEATEQGLISIVPVDLDDPEKRQSYTFGSGAVIGKTIMNLADAFASKDKPYVKALKVANAGYALSEIIGGIAAARDELVSSGDDKNIKNSAIDEIRKLRAEIDELKKKLNK